MVALQPRLVPTRTSTSRPSVDPSSRVTSNAREPAHLPLHRRLLYPYDPPEKSIPPLIPGDTPELIIINERLHHLIALTLRAYVLSWYPRFSRDRSLLPHIHQSILRSIVTPILTSVYEHPDRLCEFLLLDLPTILALHVETYWSARAAVASGLVGRGEERLERDKEVGVAYHARLPLLSVDLAPSIGVDSGIEGETGTFVLSPLYLTSLADAILRLHLSPSEYGSHVERLMTRELLGRSVLGSVGRRLGQGWFWWSIGLKFLCEPGSSPLAGKEVRQERSDAETVLRFFSRVWAVVVLVWTMGSSVVAMHSAAPPVEERYCGIADPWLSLGRAILGVDGRAGLDRPRWRRRLVWGVVEMIIGLFGPVLDRLLPQLDQTKLLTPQSAIKLIDLLEHIVFPLDGYPGPSPVDPTPSEAMEMRLRLERRSGELIPPSVRKMLGWEDRDTRALLDPLENAGCNAHLVGMLLDATVGAVIPELVAGDSAVDQGWAEGEAELSAESIPETDELPHDAG